MGKWITFDLDVERQRLRNAFVEQLDEQSRRELEAMRRGDVEGFVTLDLAQESRKLTEGGSHGGKH